MFLLVKLMAETSTFTLVFYRSLVQIAISLATLLRRGEDPLGPPGETRFYLSVRGTFGAAAVCCWFFGIQVLPLPDAGE
jgi:drug/metabolite transporter (DMT)-like permease